MEKDHYSISQVVKKLNREFPDLTVSKVRYLESKGLIKPKRKPSGYRIFSERDIQTLREILILQRDKYYPLDVIKEQLESGSIPAGKIDSSPTTTHYESVKAEDLIDELNISSDFLTELEKFGLVQPENTKEGRLYSPQDVAIINTASKFYSFGIEPRHTRAHENFVSKEALAIEQILYPLLQQKSEQGTERAKKIFNTLLNLSLNFHKQLLLKKLKNKFPVLFEDDKK